MTKERITAVHGLLTRLDDHIFATDINLASGLSQAAQFAYAHPVVESLVELTKKEPNTTSVLLERTRNLSQRSIDPRYESPFDPALLGILVVLARIQKSVADVAATIALGAPQTWWARHFAHALLNDAENLRWIWGEENRTQNADPFPFEWRDRAPHIQNTARTTEIAPTVDLSRVFPGVSFYAFDDVTSAFRAGVDANSSPMKVNVRLSADVLTTDDEHDFVLDRVA